MESSCGCGTAPADALHCPLLIPDPLRTRRLRALWRMTVVTDLAAVGKSATAQDGFIQNQAQFEAALQNRSTSPSFVLVTVVDGQRRL